MNGKSLGIIETVGFIPAIEAADTAAKSANVTLAGCQYVGAGLVSILMTGDVGSVKASVDAGRNAAQRVGEVRSFTVIARTAQGLETIIKKETISDKTPEPSIEEQSEPQIEEQIETQSEDSDKASIGHDSLLPKYEKQELENMTVQKLRYLARKTKLFSIAKDKIKFSRKKDLIKAILNHYDQDKE